MAKRRSHAAKKQVTSHTIGRHSVERASYESQVFPIRSSSPAEPGKENIPPFLAWPFHLFEMSLMPWRSLTPLEAWVENWRTDGNPVFPKTQSKETDTEYLYMVELPGVTRDQLALHFQNGMIMLSIKKPDEQRGKFHHYQHLHSIRRAFILPVYTDGEAITAELKSGVLTIVIPKTDKPVSPQPGIIDIS